LKHLPAFFWFWQPIFHVDHCLIALTGLASEKSSEKQRGLHIMTQQEVDDDFLSLLAEDEPQRDRRAVRHWRILIVDDDDDVHQATEFALTNTPVLGRPLMFLHAYSSDEAVEVLKREIDVAVILLDVVMEREDAGLRLVRRIREELELREVRIILRTGQPGYAPEMDAIRDYDINDYKTKSELSRNRLFTTLTTAIRSYDQIHAISASRRGLGMIIRSSAELMARHGLQEFAAGVITQLAGLLHLAPEGIVCAHQKGEGPESTRVIAAAGSYLQCVEKPLSSLGRPRASNQIHRALEARQHQFGIDSTTLFFPTESGNEMAAYIETSIEPDGLDFQLLDVFCTNITIGLDNVVLFAQLNDFAYKDQMLGIPNRLSLVQKLNAIGPDKRSEATLALVDIDHFSQLNDALGHSHGDLLLEAVAQRLRETLSPETLIARVDADTFGVLASDEEVSPERLQSAFRTPFTLDNSDHLLTVSIGLARIADCDGDGSTALRCANIALNYAKEGTRGQHCYFTREMELHTRNRVRLLQDLRTAFAADKLFVVYQPQVRLSDRKVLGVEALLRWRNEDGQFIPPEQFIPLAESSGMIISLGHWVLRTACMSLREFEQSGVTNLRMAVNVSVSQFRHPNFLSSVDAVLSESGINPQLLELEITESVAMLEYEFMFGMINELKTRGVMVAIDDFGTGFSSLSHLERLNVDRLKIDGSFIAQMTQAQSSHRIVETILQLGHGLDLTVIAEGIETEEQATALAALGCDEGQGYLFARPLEPDALKAYIRTTIAQV
jgi:diguanylate cyclase